MKINFMYKFFKHLAAAVSYDTTVDSAFINGTFTVDFIILHGMIANQSI